MIIETFIEDQVGDDPQVLLADGLDDAFIGIGCAFNAVPVAIYNRDKVIEILMTRDVMTYEEAWEFFEFNISGAYVGESTPIFMSVMNRPTGQFKDTPAAQLGSSLKHKPKRKRGQYVGRKPSRNPALNVCDCSHGA